MSRFTFGGNWRSYSHVITDAVVSQAAASLVHLLGEEAIQGKTIVDVGCGSGLFTLAFLRLGAAQVYAIDIDSDCVNLTQQLVQSESNRHKASVQQLSILDPALAQRIPPVDTVYAWGSLHHTGAMWQALECAASLVSRRGLLAVALYNRHWTSLFWKFVKWVYNYSPTWLQRMLVRGYFSIGQAYNCLTRRAIVTKRGMDVWHDIQDWLGGYPYEYTSPQEVQAFAQAHMWEVLKMVMCQGTTGCNEFVFRLPAASKPGNASLGLRRDAPRQIFTP